MSQVVEPPIYSVAECNELVNTVLENEIGTILVEGELSNVQIKRNQWVTFDLKDSESVVNCFSTVYKVGRSYEHGMRVRILAKPRIYVPYGKYSLTVEAIQPIGVGAMQQAYQLLLSQLTKEGLFDAQHKRLLPKYPERIGLITSPEGAALADVRKVLTERWGSFSLQLYPVHVQGQNAASDVIQAIHFFNEHTQNDVIILTRGGGSIEDLQAFNDEKLARTIFSSRIPIICAIGHEKDTTIAELVADLRAATPSNAAQLAVPDRTTVLANLREFSLGLNRRIENGLNEYQATLGLQSQKLLTSVQHLLSSTTKRLDAASDIAQALDPHRILKRGYSFTTDQDSGTVIRTVDEVVPGQRLAIHLLDGVVATEVQNATKKAL